MLLHRYFGSHAFETLKEAKLLASRISSFNDPFEFLYVCEFGKMTPDLARQLVRSYRSDPGLLLQLVGLNKQLPISATEREIQRLLDKSEPLIVEGLLNDWPAIANKTDLTLERRKQIIDQESRAICFSDPSRVKRLDEILLWSHYANKHRGVRVGFEFPYRRSERFEIVEMEYREDRVKVNCSFWAEADALKRLEESARVKSKAWEYEREFRLFTKTNLCEPKKIEQLHPHPFPKGLEVVICRVIYWGLHRLFGKSDSLPTVEHFLEFKRDWVRTVDFGALCPDNEIQLVSDLLKTDYLDVIARKAAFHKTEYALEYKEIH